MAQSYEVEADNEYVIRGNSAIMKCEVPSFVSDFVTVENWQDSKGNTYLPGADSGNRSFSNFHIQFPLFQQNIHTFIGASSQTFWFYTIICE